MPSAEVVASALLHLKNNPRLFKKWRKQRGSTFKADGKVFRDAYQLTSDEPHWFAGQNLGALHAPEYSVS